MTKKRKAKHKAKTNGAGKRPVSVVNPAALLVEVEMMYPDGKQRVTTMTLDELEQQMESLRRRGYKMSKAPDGGIVMTAPENSTDSEEQKQEAEVQAKYLPGHHLSRNEGRKFVSMVEDLIGWGWGWHELSLAVGYTHRQTLRKSYLSLTEHGSGGSGRALGRLQEIHREEMEKRMKSDEQVNAEAEPKADAPDTPGFGVAESGSQDTPVTWPQEEARQEIPQPQTWGEYYQQAVAAVKEASFMLEEAVAGVPKDFQGERMLVLRDRLRAVVADYERGEL